MKKKINIFAVVSVTILILYTITLVVPLLWVLFTSFKDPIEFDLNKFGFTTKLSFDNYVTVMKSLFIEIYTKDGGVRNVYLPEMFGNTLLYAVGCSVISTITNCIVAYIVARYSHFRFTKIIYAFVIFTMVLPTVGNLPSQIQMAKTLNFYDHMWGIYLMKAYFGGTYFLVFYASFKGYAKEYAEAAKLDGAGETSVMLRIMLPLAAPTIGAVVLLTFITYWNDYQAPMIFLPSSPTMAYGLYRFQSNTLTEASGITVKLAACSIVIVPIFIIFVIFKDKLTGNITIGGIKG